MLFQVLNDLRMKDMTDGFFGGHVLRMLLGFLLLGSSSHETSYSC